MVHLCVSSSTQPSKNKTNNCTKNFLSSPVTVLLVPFLWHNKVDDDVIYQVSKNIIDRSVKVAKEMGLHHPFIYQNYAAKHQDVFAGYGEENRQRLREIRAKYDPNGVFQRLTPGYFKV